MPGSTEIGQLELHDVRLDEGIPCIFIDDASHHERCQGSKSIKTDTSRRRIPIHADRLKLGPLERARRLEGTGADRLFPDLARNRFDRYTANASRCCNRLINQVVDDPRVVFHSFRHLFKDLCREVGMLEYVSDQLTGHAPRSIGTRYGNGVSIQHLKDAVETLRFAFIDWEVIYSAFRL